MTSAPSLSRTQHRSLASIFQPGDVLRTAGAILTRQLPQSVLLRNDISSVPLLPQALVSKILDLAFPTQKNFPLGWWEGTGEARQDKTDVVLGKGLLRLCPEAVESFSHSFSIVEAGIGEVSIPAIRVTPLEVLLDPKYSFSRMWRESPYLTITFRPEVKLKLTHFTLCLSNNSVAKIGHPCSNATCTVHGQQTVDSELQTIYLISKGRNKCGGALVPNERPKWTYAVHEALHSIEFQSIRFLVSGLGGLNQCVCIQSIELFGSLVWQDRTKIMQ